MLVKMEIAWKSLSDVETRLLNSLKRAVNSMEPSKVHGEELFLELLLWSLTILLHNLTITVRVRINAKVLSQNTKVLYFERL